MKTNLINDYKSFQGSYNKQMPLLIQEGLQPLTAKDVMEYRIKAIQSNNEDEFDFWLDHYFDTADGLAYHDNNLIVVPNSQELLNINPESKLSNGSLILSPKQYERLSKEHEVIKRDNIISGKPLTKEQAKEHPIWLKLAQEDKSLLNEYADAIFSKAKEIYNYNENMGIYPQDDQKTPVMRDWYFRSLYGRSGADAKNNLNNNCRLLGVRRTKFRFYFRKNS